MWRIETSINGTTWGRPRHFTQDIVRLFLAIAIAKNVAPARGFIRVRETDRNIVPFQVSAKEAEILCTLK